MVRTASSNTVTRTKAVPASGREIIELIEEDDGVRETRASSHDLNIGLILWPDFPLLSLAGFVDALRHAADLGDNSQKLRCSWTVMGLRKGARIAASCGVEVACDAGYVDPSQFDYVGVVGGLIRSMDQGSPEALSYISRVAQNKVPLIGICTGTFLLAGQGYLDGRRTCIHPYHFEEFQSLFPRVHAVTNLDYIDDGDRLSCAGGISIISLATYLIGRHCGPERATKTVYQMSVPNKADTANVAVSQAIGYTRVSDPRLRRAMFLLERSLLEPISPAWIAEQVGLSERQLGRLFDAEFGLPPSAYIRATRLRYARWLLQNSDETVTEVALRTGFADCAHFVRQFRREFGETPGALRKSKPSPAPA
jgi:transcriptional regulator GlxA family with amidase domain